MYKFQLLKGFWYGQNFGGTSPQEVAAREHLLFENDFSVVTIPRDFITVGRALGNDVVIEDRNIKKFMFVMSFSPEGYARLKSTDSQSCTVRVYRAGSEHIAPEYRAGSEYVAPESYERVYAEDIFRIGNSELKLLEARVSEQHQ